MHTNSLSSDLSALIQSPIREQLPDDVVKEVLSSFPFVPIPMALNLRTMSSPNLAANILFRSGCLSHLSPESLSLLKSDLKITTIFDLRSRKERKKAPSPDIEGIETVWVPSTTDIDAGPICVGSTEVTVKGILQDVKPGDFVANNGDNGYITAYNNLLQTHRQAYRGVFNRLRDGEGGVLFHCTAGKDRTGVLAALIHALVETPREAIANDYGLTRIGIEPFRERLLRSLLEQMGRGGEPVDIDQLIEEPGMETMCGVRASSILAFLDSLNSRYGNSGQIIGSGKYIGVKGYLITELDLSVDDLEQIKKKLAGSKEIPVTYS